MHKTWMLSFLFILETKNDDIVQKKRKYSRERVVERERER